MILGFFVQVSAFYIARRDFEFEVKKTSDRHNALMEMVKNLPPEEAIEKLLTNMN